MKEDGGGKEVKAQGGGLRDKTAVIRGVKPRRSAAGLRVPNRKCKPISPVFS